LSAFRQLGSGYNALFGDPLNTFDPGYKNLIFDLSGLYDGTTDDGKYMKPAKMTVMDKNHFCDAKASSTIVSGSQGVQNSMSQSVSASGSVGFPTFGASASLKASRQSDSRSDKKSKMVTAFTHMKCQAYRTSISMNDLPRISRAFYTSALFDLYPLPADNETACVTVS